MRQYFDNPAQFATYDAFYVTLGVTTAVLAGTAGLGSTLLGGIAIAQIKRSGGKLYGLPLAALDLLIHPLAALFAGSAYYFGHYFSATAFNARHPELVATLTLLIPLVVCLLAGWGAWRKIAGTKTTADLRTGVKRAAIGLIVVGAINAVMVIGFWLVWFPESSWTQHPVVCTLVQSGFLFFGAMTVLIFRGALKMLNREDYAACRLAALCSLFSFNIVSLPVGIWALVVLSQPEVKAVFQDTAPQKPTEGGTPIPPASALVTQPQLCTLAVISAVWAVVGLVCAAAVSFWVYGYRGIPPWVMLIVLLGIICIICAPITGAVAISRIRRSNGQLTGLPFAAFGLLCYPMLLLAAGAFGLTHLIQIALWTKVHTGYSYQAGKLVDVTAPPPGSYPGMTFMILDSLVALVVCFFAGFLAWRKIAAPPLPSALAKSGA